MKRGKLRLKLFAAFVTAFLYVVFFPAASGKELFLLRDWTAGLEDLSGPPRRAEANADAWSFRLAGRLGYIDAQGNILFHENIAYDAAMGDDFFVNYSALPLNLIIRGRQGEFLANIGGNGYPFVKNGKLFLVSPDGHGLARVDNDGNILWERKFPSLITVADAGEKSIVLGFLNGGIAVLGNDGDTDYEVPPERGGLPVTLQAGIAADAARFAAVSGAAPQRLRLFAREASGYAPVFEAELRSSYRRAMVARYFSLPDYFVFEQPGGAGVLQAEKRELSFVPLPGGLLALADERPGGLFLTMSASGGRMYCSAFLPDGNKAFTFSYTGSSAGREAAYSLRAAKDSFLLGAGTRLYRVTLGVL